MIPLHRGRHGATRRVACMGNSAGAAMSLWIAFHDDLAGPKADDAVARQSTRLSFAIATNGQTSYDPRFIRKLFPGYDVNQHPAIAALAGVPRGADLLALSPEQYAIYGASAPINLVTDDDPPVMLSYGGAMSDAVTSYGIGIHHPRFGVPLKEKMDALCVPCVLKAKGDPGPTPIEYIRERFGVK